MSQVEHVLHQQIESTLTEIPKGCDASGRTAVTPMIVCVHGPARYHKHIYQAFVSPEMFAHAMGNLDHTTNPVVAFPPGARDVQPICTAESKFKGRSHGHFLNPT
jgi:hypothetical protein